jgi:hypothetical protein
MLKPEIVELIVDHRMAEAGDTGPEARRRNRTFVSSHPKAFLVLWLDFITAPSAEKEEAKKIMDSNRPPVGRTRSRMLRTGR